MKKVTTFYQSALSKVWSYCGKAYAIMQWYYPNTAGLYGYTNCKVAAKAVLFKFVSHKSKNITTFSKGKKVKVYVDSEVKDAKKRVWIKVKTGNKTGYVLMKKLKKVNKLFIESRTQM